MLPGALSYFEIWPPALVTYNLSVPTLLDVPKCDVGLGISPELRALVAHATSRAFGCQYCTAHTAVMGTLVRGPNTKLQLSGRVVAARSPGQLRRAERVAVEYAEAVGRVPSRVTPDLLAALREHHRPAHFEAIANVAMIMGWLCRFMDSLGTPLETAIAGAASGSLEGTGWSAGKHDDPDTAGDGGSQALARPSRIGLVREVPQAALYERAALAMVPSGARDQDTLLGDKLGFVPAGLSVARASVRRLLTHWWVERLAAPGVDVDAATKHRMGWVLAREARNDALAAQFAFVAHRAGVTAPQLTDDVRAEASRSRSKEATALALAHATARTSSELAPGLVESLVAAHSAPGIIELLLQVSIVHALARHAATFPVSEYEPEVASFVAEHGDALGLPRRPAA